MPLVNIEQWRAERGFNGGPGSFPSSNAPPPPQPQEPDYEAQIAELSAEVLRQRDLIVKLQGALQSYVNRDQAQAMAEAARARRPATARVLRRPRQLKGPLPAPTIPTP